MSLEKKIAVALKWSVIGKLTGQLVTWCFTFLTIRLLTPEDYGLFAITVASIALFTVINEFGLGAAIVQSKNLSEQQIRSANGFIILTNVAIFIIISMLSYPISIFFEEARLASLLQVSSLQFLVGALAVIPRSILVREIEFKNKEIIFLIKSILGAISTYIFALEGYGVWSLIYGAIISSVFTTVALNVAVKKFYTPSIRLNPIKNLLSYSYNILVQRVIWWFYTQVDVFMLKKLFDTATVGIFFTAKHLASMPQEKLNSIVNEIVLTSFAKISNDKERVRLETIRILSMLSTMIFPIYYGMAATSNLLVPLLIGEQWVATIEPLFLLCLVYPLRMLNSPISEIINALGLPKVSTYGLIINSVIMIVSIVIGAQWGIVGVCIAWIFGYTTSFFIFNAMASKYTTVSVFDIVKSIFPAFINSAIMIVFLKLIFFHFIPEQCYTNLFLGIVVGMSIYTLLTYVNNREICINMYNLIRK